MTVIASCRCGQSFNAKPELAGQRVKCPACGQPLQIPAVGSKVASQSKAAAAPIAVTCQCGRSFQAPAHLAGKRVACPGCQSPLSIRQPQPAAQDPLGTGLDVPLGAGQDVPLGAGQDDPFGNLGDFANDPLMGGMPAQASHASPAYAPVGARKAKKKSKFNPKIILYIVGGIGGVILLGCTGFFIAGIVVGVNQGINESRGVWKIHVSASGGYAAMLPGRVRTKNHRQEFANFTAAAEEAIAVVGNGDEIYISVFRHSGFAVPQQTPWLQKIADVNRPEMAGATVSDTTVAGRPAIRIEGILKIDDRSSHKIGWFMHANDRLYDLSILSGDKPADPETVSKFIDSFRLMGVSPIR